ncbi:MAG: ribonuclease R [Gloeomargarita sp. SKYBB_i_bin120]|nr:ribonuclease R [Gloeomargarita sp. SKYG98]MCS7292849.1 ribonuclease R [Gloeomargarita sp. SKYB120]MDW8178412.1 ribonuclease R [Gloeomargarita sp. SKYBB_i_bin120]
MWASGTLVEFETDGGTRLGVIQRPDGKKNWIASDAQGRTYSIHPRQVSFVVSDRAYTIADIPDFEQTAAAYTDPEALEVAWELLSGENRLVNPEELAQLLFNQTDPPLCYAAHRLLRQDRIFFKQRGEYYEPRSPQQVQELRHQLQKEAQKQQELQAFYDKVRQALAGQAITWTPKERHVLEQLEQFVIVEGQPPRPVAELLTHLERAVTPSAARELLVALGWWHPHENLALRRSSVPTTFPADVLEAASMRIHTPPPDPDAPWRQDLTGLKVYTIDDSSTTEIDDGLSWERLPDGRERLWIHIADPSRWLTPGDVLDQEARRRGTSVYLPTGVIPMFPEALATGPMSLQQGQTCCALSFAVTLEPSGAIADYQIMPSWVRPTYRLTYDDVDELLPLQESNEGELSHLYQWAQRRLAWRLAQGAIQIQMPEAQIKVVDDQVEVQVQPPSPARFLVAEMMILAGEVTARYAQAAGLPMPFRSQAQPELPPEEELLQLPSGLVRTYAIRRCLTKSEVSITPGRHASLGLDAYVQATSPIRRYGDLLAHWQLKAHLRGEAPMFDAAELQTILQGVMAATQEASAVERQTNRYWSLEYLRRHSDTVWTAVVLRWLREEGDLVLVLLEDLGLELSMRVQRSVKLGEQLQVQVTHVDPYRDVIHLQEVTHPQPSSVLL